MVTVKIVEVENEVALRCAVEAEVVQVSITVHHDGVPGGGGVGKIPGHHCGGASQYYVDRVGTLLRRSPFRVTFPRNVCPKFLAVVAEHFPRRPFGAKIQVRWP